MEVAQVVTGVALVSLTLGLVVATFRYVKQTQLMVGEMRASREEACRARKQSLLPKLALSLEYRGPAFALVAIQNVGPGAALDVDLELVFEPCVNGPYPRDARSWRTNLIAPGEAHWFAPANPQDGSVLYVEGLAQAFERITLVGTVRDALAVTHQVDERFDDLPGRDSGDAPAHGERPRALPLPRDGVAPQGADRLRERSRGSA